MPIADCALQSKQLSSLATARPTGEPTEAPTRSTRDAAGAFQRARSIGLVPHTLSTAHTHFGLTSKVWRLTAKSCGAGRNLQNSEKKFLQEEQNHRPGGLAASVQRSELAMPPPPAATAPVQPLAAQPAPKNPSNANLDVEMAGWQGWTPGSQVEHYPPVNESA